MTALKSAATVGWDRLKSATYRRLNLAVAGNLFYQPLLEHRFLCVSVGAFVALTCERRLVCGVLAGLFCGQ